MYLLRSLSILKLLWNVRFVNTDAETRLRPLLRLLALPVDFSGVCVKSSFLFVEKRRLCLVGFKLSYFVLVNFPVAARFGVCYTDCLSLYDSFDGCGDASVF